MLIGGERLDIYLNFRQDECYGHLRRVLIDKLLELTEQTIIILQFRGMPFIRHTVVIQRIGMHVKRSQ